MKIDTLEEFEKQTVMVAALCAERGLPPDATARKLWGRQ